MAAEDFITVSRQKFAEQTISASATAGFRVDTNLRKLYGDPRGFQLTYDAPTGSDLNINIDGQTFFLPEGVAGVIIQPDADLPVPFGGATITASGANDATGVNVTFLYMRRK